MKKSPKPIIEHFPDFLDYLEVEKGLANKSQENYARFLNKFKEWLKMNRLEDLKPDELSPEHIWQYRLYLSRHLDKRGKTLKKSTQNYYLIALRSLLSYFAERDILSLPADKIKLIKEPKERSIRFLNLEQIEKLLLAPDIKTKIGLRDRAILETLFSTGLRVAELVALNRDQINLKNIKEELEVGIIGKGGYPRTVYFSPRSLEWLKKYLDQRDDKEKALFINFSRNKKISGKRLTTRAVENIVKKYVKLVGLPLFTTPHTLRHSYATDLLIQGVDLRVVQEFLGHKNIVTTQVYTHLTSRTLKEIHKKFHSGKRLRN